MPEISLDNELLLFSDTEDREGVVNSEMNFYFPCIDGYNIELSIFNRSKVGNDGYIVVPVCETPFPESVFSSFYKFTFYNCTLVDDEESESEIEGLSHHRVYFSGPIYTANFEYNDDCGLLHIRSKRRFDDNLPLSEYYHDIPTTATVDAKVTEDLGIILNRFKIVEYICSVEKSTNGGKFAFPNFDWSSVERLTINLSHFDDEIIADILVQISKLTSLSVVTIVVKTADICIPIIDACIKIFQNGIDVAMKSQEYCITIHNQDSKPSIQVSCRKVSSHKLYDINLLNSLETSAIIKDKLDRESTVKFHLSDNVDETDIKIHGRSIVFNNTIINLVLARIEYIDVLVVTKDRYSSNALVIDFTKAVNVKSARKT